MKYKFLFLSEFLFNIFNFVSAYWSFDKFKLFCTLDYFVFFLFEKLNSISIEILNLKQIKFNCFNTNIFLSLALLNYEKAVKLFNLGFLC